jgi:hypothetical protein
VTGGETLERYGKNMKTGAINANVRVWSGNWLNWMTSSRIDVVRQVLYGGKRVVDLPGLTYITAEDIPENAGAWSYDDFTQYFWLDYNEGSPYYDTRKYTPINPDRWAGKYRRLNSYGRADKKLYIIDGIWFMRQKEDVTNHEGFRSFNAYYPPKYRQQYTPLTYVLNSFAEDYKLTELEIVVEACRPLTKKEVHNFTERLDYSVGKSGVSKPSKADYIPEDALIEKGDYCQRYGDYFKPTGLLQKYAEMDQALFGLFTGAFNDVNRWDAGWLRHNVGSIKNQVNPDGTYKGTSKNNIFLMFDSITQVTKARLKPLSDKRDKVDATFEKYRIGWRDPMESNFGNPMGEMVYAALLYFAKNTTTATYSVYPSSSLMQSEESVDLPRLGSSSFDSWNSPLFANAGDCLKPVILILSSTTTSHDGDMLPGSPHALREGAGSIPTLNLNYADGDRFVNTEGLSKSFNMSAYLNVITKLEGFSGQYYYIANTNSGTAGAKTEGKVSRQPPSDGDENLCIPRKITSLAQVRGICPGAPQTYGTYAVAAAAYYGNTHDFDGSGNKVQTFAVALPTIFPEIKLAANGQVISISPVAMSVSYPCGNNDGDTRFCKDGNNKPYGIQYVGPFATNVIQWRADDEGRVYSGALFAGFTGRLEGEGNDYQLDAPVRYYFDLIRECYQGECDPDSNMPHKESFRYEQDHKYKEGYPSRDDERDTAYVYYKQEKYSKKYNYQIFEHIIDTTRCNDKNRDKITGCGSAADRQIAKKILNDFADGRYAAAPFKRHREWVYKSWDHASRPNYIYSSERPKNYHIAAYMPKRWSQIPAYFHRPTGILSHRTDPDPTLMQSYARSVYSQYGGYDDTGGNSARQAEVRKLPGASNFYDYSSNDITKEKNQDFVPDETSSLFIDRPFTDLGYEEVMDVYGYIGEPGRIYKKIGKPEEMKDAIGVAVFVYSLYEKIDNTDRNMPINIGYYLHGGLNFPESKKDNPSRVLGNAEGVYLEIQNEHNYMGGSPMTILNEGLTSHMTSGEEKGLMTIAHSLNTPPTCYRAGTIKIEPQNFTAADSNPVLFKDGKAGNLQMPGFVNDFDVKAHNLAVPSCGSARLPLTATRFFRFPAPGQAPAPPNYLPDPLWLAAKYGGFNDENHNGKPEKDEYDILPAPNGDGIPDNYFYAANLSQLKEKLSEAFERIMSTLNVGTATSASVNQVLGGGVTVRTYFQTVHTPVNSPDYPEIKWLGGTYALFVDLWGNLREDTNGNGILDLDCGFAGDANSSRGPSSKGDWIVEFVDCNRLPTAADTLACSKVRDEADIKSVARVFPDQNGKNLPDRNARLQYVPLQKIYTIWDLSKTLARLNSYEEVTKARALTALASKGRRVYFYHELLNGSTPTTFGNNNIFSPDKASALAPYLLQSDALTAKNLIDYVLGWDNGEFRSRQTLSPWPDLSPGTPITCRLGDIINSQPIIVGSPFSSYDNQYSDGSYAQYRNNYAKRRHLAVVGANDGMLHAVNLGKPYSLREGQNGYKDDPLTKIGSEIWSFIPQSILPHLQWLARQDYAHSYYLDLTPTVVEVKDPSKGSDAWRTLIIGSLRFGGRAIETKSNPPSYSYSEVFALDVTNPDTDPILLWRFSHPQLGLVVARPTVVRNTSGGDKWYALIGSGPTYDNYDPAKKITVPSPDKGPNAYKGYSNQSAKVFVFDAINGPSSEFRILETNRPKSFVAQTQVLRAPASTVIREGDSVSWSNALAYFSLVQSAPDKDTSSLLCLEKENDIDAYLSWPQDRCGSSKYGNKGYLDKGAVFRLNMTNSSGNAINPNSWQQNFKPFFETDRPVTAAVNATYDAKGRLWVVFGTGRYYSNDDSHLCEGAGDTKECRLNHVNYIYGIKEPINSQGELIFNEVSENNLMDVSNILVYPEGEVQTLNANGAVMPINSGGEELNSYEKLSNVISDNYGGYRRALKTNSEIYVDNSEVDNPFKPGSENSDWWKGLSVEMVVDQAALVPYGPTGSIMAYTSFLPDSVSCGAAGRSFALLLDTFTGLPKPDFGATSFSSINNFQESIQQSHPITGKPPVSDHMASFEGKTSAPTLVITGTTDTSTSSGGLSGSSSSNGGTGGGGKHAKISYINQSGSDEHFNLPDGNFSKGGVKSWREVLDFSNIGITD